jgi:hypothetical protein
MVTIDCSELTDDEMLALASAISDTFEGKALSLTQDRDIVIDEISAGVVTLSGIRSLVEDFISRRKDSQYYSIEVDGDLLIVHSADPVKALSRIRRRELPSNLKKCPFCGFLSQYDEEMMVHIRVHGFRP